MYSGALAHEVILNLIEKNKHIETVSSDYYTHICINQLLYMNIVGLNQRKRTWVILFYDYLKTDNFTSFIVHERGLMNNVSITEDEKLLKISHFGLFNINIFKVDGLNVLKL